MTLVPESTPSQRHTETVDELHRDWGWLRPALTFLLGVLVGVVVIAATRPSANVPTPHVGNLALTTTCEQLSSDSRNLADLAAKSATAAQQLDLARLAELQQSIRDSEAALDTDLAGCHR